MKVIYNKFLPIKGFYAITIIKWIFVREEYKYYAGGSVERLMINHESIHEQQILDFTPTCFPSWLRYTIGTLCFYPLYIINWIIMLFPWMFTGGKVKPYASIAAEQEAYNHETDYQYIGTRPKLRWLKNFFKPVK